MSLIDGNIPPHTVCPWKDQCDCRELCRHTGTNHKVAFSCATARGFEITNTRVDSEYFNVDVVEAGQSDTLKGYIKFILKFFLKGETK